jgi:hypothetical protein
VVSPLVCEAEAVSGVAVVVGWAVLAAVFDELCVLAVPPLTLGCTMILGAILNVGSTVIVGVALAVAPPVSTRMCPTTPRPCSVATLALVCETVCTCADL